MTKTYSSKSNAARAFRKQFPDVGKDMTADAMALAGHIDADAPDKWVVNNPDTKAEDDFEAGMAAERAKREEAQRATEGHIDEAQHPMLAGKAPAPQARQDGDAPKRARAPSGSSNGLKIEANRATSNGVTRPSTGGKCRGIWDMLDAMTHGQATPVTAAQAREAGAGKFDKTTIMVQFYRWRKFNGIEGRQA